MSVTDIAFANALAEEACHAPELFARVPNRTIAPAIGAPWEVWIGCLLRAGASGHANRWSHKLASTHLGPRRRWRRGRDRDSSTAEKPHQHRGLVGARASSILAATPSDQPLGHRSPFWKGRGALARNAQGP